MSEEDNMGMNEVHAGDYCVQVLIDEELYGAQDVEPCVLES